MENRGKDRGEITITLAYDDLTTMVWDTIQRWNDKEKLAKEYRESSEEDDSDEEMACVNVPEDIAAWIENTDNSIEILRKMIKEKT